MSVKSDGNGLLLRLHDVLCLVDNFGRHMLAAATDPGAHLPAAAANRLAFGHYVLADVLARLGDCFAFVDDLVGSFGGGPPDAPAAMSPAWMRDPDLRVGLSLIGLRHCARRQRPNKTNLQTDCKEQSEEHKNFLH